MFWTERDLSLWVYDPSGNKLFDLKYDDQIFELIARFPLGAILKPRQNISGYFEIRVNYISYSVEVVKKKKLKAFTISPFTIPLRERTSLLNAKLLFSKDADNSIKNLMIDLKSALEESDKNFVVFNPNGAKIKNGSIFYYPGYQDYDMSNGVAWGDDRLISEYSRNWMYALNSLSFLDSYLSNLDFERYRYCLDVVIDWKKHHIDNRKSGKFSWYDMAVGLRAIKLAYLLYWGVKMDMISEDEFLSLSELILFHVEDLFDENRIAWQSNHGLYQLLGLYAVTYYLPIKDGDKYAEFAKSSIREMLEKDFTPSGFHLEHSPSYHVLLSTYIYKLYESGWIKDVWLIELAEKTASIVPYLFHPDNKISQIGDSNLTSLNQALSRVPSVLGDQILYNKKISNIYPEIFCQKDSGFFIYRGWSLKKSRTHDSYLIQHSGFHRRTHKHADDFSFEWSSNGLRVLTDSGIYGYNEGKLRDYALSTAAHNCVQIDGENYSTKRQDVFNSAIKDFGRFDNIVYVESNLIRRLNDKSLVDHRRVLFLMDDRFLIVYDHLYSNTFHSFTQWNHFSPCFDLSVIGDFHVAESVDKSMKVKIVDLSKESTVMAYRGSKENPCQGWYTSSPNVLSPRSTLGFTQGRKKSATFLTLFSLDDEGVIENSQFHIGTNGKYLKLKWVTGSYINKLEFRSNHKKRGVSSTFSSENRND